MTGASTTVVLIGNQTADSLWVVHEIKTSVDRGMGIVGVRLGANAGVPAALAQAGEQILEWDEVAGQFNDAVERAIDATRGPMPQNSSGICARA